MDPPARARAGRGRSGSGRGRGRSRGRGRGRGRARGRRGPGSRRSDARDGGGGHQRDPETRWEDVVPTRSCAAELRESAAIKSLVPLAPAIADDCGVKCMEVPYADPPVPVQLEESELFAVVAYTHDTNGDKERNLYWQLNRQLRRRGVGARTEMVTTWGTFVHYALKGMRRLPDFEGVVYRGYPDKATTLAQYKLGRPIQWGAFTSTSTDLEATKGFTDQANGVIFKITVSSGKDINAYSFFPCEGEILLSPNHRFIVSSAPYERGGYTMVDMVQQKGGDWIS